MKSHTAADFIGADITVRRILRVNHTRTESWGRARKLARDCEGLLYFVSGTIEYYFDGYTFTAYPGQVIKLPSGIPYNGHKLDDAPLEFYLVDFECEPNEFLEFPIPDSFYPTDKSAVIKAFESIHRVWHSGTVCSRLECKNDVSKLLCELAVDYAVHYCQYDDRSRILQICEYIKKNSGSHSFRVSDAAEHFHISSAHLRRIFSDELNTSPVAYLTSVRIERAKSQLASRIDAGIAQIADECGYSSVYYFSSAFKSAVGCTPTEYRTRMLESGNAV